MHAEQTAQELIGVTRAAGVRGYECGKTEGIKNAKRKKLHKSKTA
jgi:hypothetical protein